MTVIRIRPKSTAVREAWQWTGQPRSEWPAWVRVTASRRPIDVWGMPDAELVLHRRSGAIVIPLTEWLVRDLDSADVIQYTDAELWKEFESS